MHIYNTINYMHIYNIINYMHIYNTINYMHIYNIINYMHIYNIIETSRNKGFPLQHERKNFEERTSQLEIIYWEQETAKPL